MRFSDKKCGKNKKLERSTEPSEVKIALNGLAPISRQSGKWKGRAFIQAGRSIVRRALYMPALVAIRFNSDLAQKYQTLIHAGKPTKGAITAIMRKLIICANSLLKNNRKWTKLTT